MRLLASPVNRSAELYPSSQTFPSEMVMKTKAILATITLAVAITMGPWLFAQVQTEVPAVVPGAKPVTVQQIKVHGAALEDNLEGDAVDRDVMVFLPPSYDQD